MLRVTGLPAFDDNYLWLIHGLDDPSRVAAVDPGDADVIEKALAAQRLTLTAILVTHHHGDHTGGIDALRRRHAIPVFGPADEAIDGVTHPLSDGTSVEVPVLGVTAQVLSVPGHTAGHIAYVIDDALFCGDTLFSAGCGRLFEGTAEQMLHSLDRLAALPDATRVYCAHEYTASNVRWALTVEPSNADLQAYARDVTARRARGEPTIPSTIGRERAVNPFLRSRLPSVRTAITTARGATVSDDSEAFGALREWKNTFR